MNRVSLLEYKNVGYAVVIVALIVTIILFNPAIFPQESLPPKEEDPTEPEPVAIYITGLTHSPSSPTPADEVDISCKASGATLVVLYCDYTDNPTGEPLKISMVSGSSSMWYGEIPAMAEGISVTYWVKASNSDTTKTSSIQSYISLMPEPDPQVYEATFVIYKEVDGAWEIVPVGGTLSGRIRIELTVLQGVEQVNSVIMSFWSIDNNDDWVKQDESYMVGIAGVTGGFVTEYDTTKLVNTVYDIRYQLLDTGGTVIYEQSLFDTGDGFGVGIDPFIIQLGLIGVIVAAVLIVSLKKRKR